MLSSKKRRNTTEETPHVGVLRKMLDKIPLKKLDLYLLKSFLGPFVLTFCIVLFILMMQFLWLYIDELVGKGLGIGVIFQFIGWGCCTLMPLALPLATLLASIMTMGTLGENSELLAMKSAGISLQRILRPLMWVAFVIVIGAFFVSNNLIPVAYNKIYTLRSDISKTKEEIKIPVGIFYDGIDGYNIRVGSRDNNNLMHDIMIYDQTGNNGEPDLTLADSGRFTLTSDKQGFLITLYNGINYHEESKMSYRDTSFTLQKIRFSYQQIVIPLENYAFTRSDEERFGNEVMAKNISQLREDRDSLTIANNATLFAQTRRAVAGENLSHPDQLDTARNQNYKQQFGEEELFAWKDLKAKQRAYTNAIESMKSAIRGIPFAQAQIQQTAFPLRRTIIETYRKFALSLACLIFFFIGAPIGAIVRKGGLGTPAIISILFFVLYWVIDISGKKLANDGAVTPFIGSFVSTIVLAPLAGFLTWKSTKDSAIFNPETYLKGVKNFFARILSKGQRLRQRADSEAERMAAEKEEREWKARDLAEKKSNLKVLFMGTPKFAVGSLKELIRNGFNVVGVVTTPDKEAGRGLKKITSAVKRFVQEYNRTQQEAGKREIPLLQPEKLRDEEFLDQLKALDADLFIVVAFRMLPECVWKIPPLGTFNLHASLLPKYRGAAPINRVIANGERETGVTTFMIDDKIDTGNILLQRACPIEPRETSQTLHDKLMVMGAELVIESINGIIDGSITPVPQKPLRENAEFYTAPKIRKEECIIEWNKEARTIDALVRSLSPRPGCSSTLVSIDESGEPIRVKIIMTEPVTTPPLGIDRLSCAGEIFTERGRLYVKCGDNLIEITKLQPAGKREMSATDFLNGFRNISEYKFS